jgi:hypothetical protein
MAAGQATEFHRDLTQLAMALVSRKAGSDYAAAWPLMAALTWILVAVRLAFEMRVNRWATAFLAMATVGYLASLMTAQLTVQPISQILVVFASSTLLTIGHVGVFVSVLVFGRHVYLDSQGLLPAQSAKPRRVKSRARKSSPEKKKSPRKAEEEPVQELPSEETGADAPHSEPQEEEAKDVSPPVLQLATGRDEPANEDADDESESPSSGEKLSKTERRRLKKLRQQEQMRRAA